MTCRPLSLLAACAALTLLAGCGGSTSDEPKGASSSGSSRDSVPKEPTAGRAPAAGKGSKDPDDLNGDGYRDLIVPVAVGADPDPGEAVNQRVGVVFGSAHGLDPATRSVYGRRDLGLPAPAGQTHGNDDDHVPAGSMTPVDLDGDGFPDLVTTVAGETMSEGQMTGPRSVPYVVWGTPTGPGTGGAKATELRLPAGFPRLGLSTIVRGDFDGDGHHDLAGVAYEGTTIQIMYGPFGRDGSPARSGSLPGWPDTGSSGELSADAIDPSGGHRVTGLLLRDAADGGQPAATLIADPRTGTRRILREGDAFAFGDFDGDGRRDLAIGDSGSRNDEPGYETEAPDVDGSLAVYSGGGGDPVTYRLPKAPADRVTDYGPGGFAAADPDGDGRDGILVATYSGATLIEGDRRTEVLREGPARADGQKIRAKWRHARPFGAGDFDGDGKDELVMAWGADSLFGLYGERPTLWWITSGASGRDVNSFSTRGFAR